VLSYGMPTKRNYVEASHQRAFIKWLGYHPHIRQLTFHIPNGGFRDAREAKELQRQGVLSGVPDIFVAIPNIPYSGLFIEFKAGKNPLSKNQKTMIERLLENGYQCKVCYSWFEAREALKEYLADKM
jgi:hypothetical protein